MKRRLTILTQWYPPEQAPFGRMMHELASDLARRDWEVTVITGFPNHPHGEVFGGYRKQWLLQEPGNGASVQRVWLATSTNRGLLARLATFATFTLTSAWRFLWGPRADVVFAVLQPLSVGVTLPLIAWLKRSKLVFNLQDLHPDTQVRLGMIRNQWLISALRGVERFAYRHCAALTVICEPFRTHAVTCGAPEERVHVVPNWVDTARIRPGLEGSEIRRAAGLDDGRFVALWAGTLGFVSGAAILLDAALLLRTDPHVRFLIVGDGPLRTELIERARLLGLDNVAFLPFQSEDRLVAVQNAGDVSIVTLAREFAESSVPSKVLAYMAAGRGVVAAVDRNSPTAKLLHDAGCGVIVEPDDPRALADALRELAHDANRVRELGTCARAHAVRHLSREAAVDQYDHLFSALAQRR
jgi:colanic acid biosynthesis glycosyl transferase WcaI